MLWSDIWFVAGHVMIWYLIWHRPWYDLLQAMLWFDIWFGTDLDMIWYLICYRTCLLWSDIWFFLQWSTMRFIFTGYVLVQVIFILFYIIEVCDVMWRDVIWHVWQVIITWPKINVTSCDIKFAITWKPLCFNSWLDFVLCTTWCEMRAG